MASATVKRAARDKALAAMDPRYCNAANRQGKSCRHPAGARTDHPSVGRCWLHGGATPIRHGRYSQIKRASLRELIAQHEADPDPLNILPELAAARALFQDFVERYDEWREALLGWWESQSDRYRPIAEDKLQALESLIDDVEDQAKTGEPTKRQEKAIAGARELLATLRTPPEQGRPRLVLDISNAQQMVGEVTRIVERIEKIRAGNAISRPDLYRIMGEMARAVDTEVKDEKTREKIKDWWMGIRVA